MLSRFDEIKLLSQCALADNRDAFGRLVEAYQPRVRRFLLNLTMGDDYLTDELAQETFIKAYLGIRSFKGLASFGTWLYRIAVNEFYSYQRRRSEELIAEGYEGEADDSEHRRVDASQAIDVAMAMLSTHERMAVTLFYIEDQPVARVAHIMGVAQGTVRSLLHRARSKMAVCLQQDINNHDELNT